nr:S8 family peptidase [Tenacibaculum sp. SG-28]
MNTSLGYSEYDNAAYNYRYSDMDGATSFIARGAEIAASKGILLVTSAGNSGNKNWKYITTPADAKSVFTVGAVDASKTIAPFSSFGPTADGRVKPDVVGHGQGVYVIDHVSGLPRLANGTSFSAPIIAGAMACFWQAFPAKSSTEIMDAIRNSSDRYANPSDQYGYGIPDFELAFATLSNAKYSKQMFTIFPNPVENILYLAPDTAAAEVTIYSILGEQIWHATLQQNTIDVSKFPAGMYVLQIDIDGRSHVKTWIKK